MPRYIIETRTGATRRTICDVDTLKAAHNQCTIAMSVAQEEGGPTFAFATDESGHWVCALERTEDGRILDHLAGR